MTLPLYVAHRLYERSAVAALSTGLLFLTRTNVRPVIALLVGVALARARATCRRAIVVAGGIALP